MNYHIAYQEYDDAKFASFYSLDELKAFMKRERIDPENVWLVEGGEMISGMGNKHMPKDFHKRKRGKKYARKNQVKVP